MDGSVSPEHHDDNGATAPVVATTSSTPSIPVFLFDNPDGTKTYSFANGEVAHAGPSDNVDSMALQRMPNAPPALGAYTGRGRAPIAQLKDEQSQIADNQQLKPPTVDPQLVTVPRADTVQASSSPTTIQDFNNVVAQDRTVISPATMNWTNNVRDDIQEVAIVQHNQLRMDFEQLHNRGLSVEQRREIHEDINTKKTALQVTRDQGKAARTVSFTA